ncbi:MAG: coproporphyrinogen dehydrogenase [Bdellovibrionales bacterium]|nr:coproporphyrinogen dehydrogenase [Bdellovibrionales bacterium]
MNNLKELLNKYNTKGNRYNCYPPPSFRVNNFNQEKWFQEINSNYLEQEGINLYIHIPFCESLCTFCGCNITITKNHDLGIAYIESLIKEWSTYLDKIRDINIASIHLGGGTPSFLSPESLDHLLINITEKCTLHSNFQGTIEIDPRNISEEQIKVLTKHNFKNALLGIQDLEPNVLRNISRPQSLQDISTCIKLLKQYGFNHIGSELIYGLPQQTVPSLEKSFTQIQQLDFDYIVLYPFAAVPWQKNNQNAFGDFSLPSTELKNLLHLTLIEMLTKNEFTNIGMGYYISKNSHFHNDKLNRNITGFNISESEILIGLGVSAISVCKTAIKQNSKFLEKYNFNINAEQYSCEASHLKTKQEQLLQETFNFIICNKTFPASDKLDELKKDGLINQDGDTCYVTGKGVNFIKNICQAIDPLFAEI